MGTMVLGTVHFILMSPQNCLAWLTLSCIRSSQFIFMRYLPGFKIGDYPFHGVKGFTWVCGLVLVSPQMLVFLPPSPGEVTSSLARVVTFAGRCELLLPALGERGHRAV